jgi:predicted component of type VI protein secretion system
MSDAIFLTPVGGDDPCGPDLRWDPVFLQLSQALDAAVAQESDSIVDAKVADAGASTPTFEDVVEMARTLSTRTKDLRVLAIYVEARWRDEGLAAFADAMEDLVAVVETWPGLDGGVHPRADEEDGDLALRAAPLGRLLILVPVLTDAIGWGTHLEISDRLEAGAALRGVFEAWNDRLDPAFGPDLPPCMEAWGALQKLLAGDAPGVEQGGEEATGTGMPGAALPTGDAWDVVEHAAELMAKQDRHSPALPVLRLLASWRSLGIIEIVDAMGTSGVSLEQLLESIKRQLEPPP